MKILKVAVICFFILILSAEISADQASDNNEKDYSPMADFIPDVLNYIKGMVRKNKNVDAKLINDDLAVIFFDFNNGAKNNNREKNPLFLIVFNEIDNKDVMAATNETMNKFLSGYTENIKTIYFHNKRNGGRELSFSWSRKTEELMEEKRCECGCVEGIFSSKLCVNDKTHNCPLAKKD